VPDTDGDGLADLIEGGGTDTNGDGAPNYLDLDDDADGILGKDEDIDANGDPRNDDTDVDGTPNYLDPDDDGDGIPTVDEPTDEDGNRVPDYLQPPSRFGGFSGGALCAASLGRSADGAAWLFFAVLGLALGVRRVTRRR
jgi:hypothetical protein